MAATDPPTPELRRFSIRLPRPLWIGLAAAVLVVLGVGVQIGVPIYRQQVVIREIEQVGGIALTFPRGPEWVRDRVGDDWMRLIEDVREVQPLSSRLRMPLWATSGTRQPAAALSRPDACYGRGPGTPEETEQPRKALAQQHASDRRGAAAHQGVDQIEMAHAEPYAGNRYRSCRTAVRDAGAKHRQVRVCDTPPRAAFTPNWQLLLPCADWLFGSHLSVVSRACGRTSAALPSVKCHPSLCVHELTENAVPSRAGTGCESFRGPPPACDWLALFRGARTPSLAFPLAHANRGEQWMALSPFVMQGWADSRE